MNHFIVSCLVVVLANLVLFMSSSSPFYSDYWRTIATLQRVSGGLSFAGSSFIVIWICRDVKQRSIVTNQVMLALSVADIVASFFGSLFICNLLCPQKSIDRSVSLVSSEPT